MQLPLFDTHGYKIDRDSWSTPQHLFDSLHHEFDFSLDAAASAYNHKCPFWFGLDHKRQDYRDALSVGWFEWAKERGLAPRVYLNPPYSFPLIEQFIRKAYDESLKGCLVVCLVCPSTCSNWWHDYAMRGEIRYIRGRVQFVPPPGVDQSTNSRDSVIVIFRGGQK